MHPIFLSTVDARDSFSRLVDRAALAKDRIIVTRHGEPMAAIVPLEDLQILEDLERHMRRRDRTAGDAPPVGRSREERMRNGRGEQAGLFD